MPDQTYYLSPYCVLYPRPDNTGAVLVHALYGSQFQLSADLLRGIAELLKGVPLDRALAGLPAEGREAVNTLIVERVLIDADELRDLNPDEVFRNRLTPVELAFHRGFNEGGYFPEGIDPERMPTSHKEVTGVASVPLELHERFDGAKDLAQCLLERRSRRFYADGPLPRRALEQLLQLTARAYALLETPGLGTISHRNYPSGGARYPLEIYPLVHRVDGLEPGIYHYHPFHHSLARLQSDEAHRSGLLELAKRSMGQPHEGKGDPAVLFIVTAVFARTVWKYRGIPYHVILQEVGALYQTMYLVATALDLALCAIGAFPELAVADVLRLDSRDEAQVGLVALGVPAAEDPGHPGIVIGDIQLVDQSPFSPEPGRKALRLTFEEGTREILDLRDLRLERGPDGTLTCLVVRGRSRGAFTPAAEEALRRALQGQVGPAIP